jgi:hypothetical protein
LELDAILERLPGIGGNSVAILTRHRVETLKEGLRQQAHTI